MIALAPIFASRWARGGLVLVGVALLLLAAWWGVKAYGNAQYDKGVKETKEEAERIAALQYQEDVSRMTQLVSGLQQTIMELQNAEPEIRTQYVTVRDRTPLPDTCRADTERVSVINGAIRAANAASVTRRAVSTASGATNR